MQTQEMASRGVSMVYALGDPAARSKLVESLVGVLQVSRSGVLLVSSDDVSVI